MRVSFHETMAGTFVAEDGTREQMVFTIDVDGPTPLAFLTGAAMDIRGTITVGSVVRDVPATGTLRVRLVTAQVLEYVIEFEDHERSEYRFAGQKDFRLFHPVTSMTTLRGHLWKDDVTIGDAELTFALRDLPQFLGSFRLHH